MNEGTKWVFKPTAPRPSHSTLAFSFRTLEQVNVREVNQPLQLGMKLSSRDSIQACIKSLNIAILPENMTFQIRCKE